MFLSGMRFPSSLLAQLSVDRLATRELEEACPSTVGSHVEKRRYCQSQQEPPDQACDTADLHVGQQIAALRLRPAEGRHRLLDGQARVELGLVLVPEGAVFEPVEVDRRRSLDQLLLAEGRGGARRRGELFVERGSLLVMHLE